MKAENGRDMLGNSIVVEWAKGKSEKRRFGDRGGGRYGDRGFRGDRRGGDRSGPRGGYGDRNRDGGRFSGNGRRDRDREVRRSRSRER